MARKHRGRRPVLETIEARALLSTAIGSPSGVAALASPLPSGTIRLAGGFHGRFHTQTMPPDAGSTEILHGSGQVAGIGHATLRGEIHEPGFVALGSAQGDLTLRRPGGTITIHLTGPPGPGGLQNSSGVFTGGITGATGKYRGLHGIGSASLSLTPVPGGHVGKFSLVLKPSILPL